MPRFRQKPVEVDAIQLTPGITLEALYEWASLPMPDRIVRPGPLLFGFKESIMALTLEGWTKASPGDWIIKGVKGEFYLCKPDVFALSYDPVGPSPAP